MQPSIFSIMTQLAAHHGAINLAQGFPNFDIDPRLRHILQQKASENVHQYMPSSGYAPLLEKLARQTFENYQRETIATTEILITAGATQGIFTTIQALVKAGDQVVILDPCYDCYDTPVTLVNATAVHVPLGSDYLPDWPAIAQAVNPKTRMLIVNNPHNPSGRVWQSQDFEALENLVEQHPNLIILSDEVYEFICFDGAPRSVQSRPKLRERSISIASFGKTFHITGWKVGYLIGPENLLQAIKHIHQYLVFSVNSVAQATLCDYLDVLQLKELRHFYAQKRNLFQSLLQNSNFELLPCEGTYFQLASYRKISAAPAMEFVQTLVKEAGVAAIPVSVFNHNGQDLKHIRFCFAKDDETLIEATNKLCRFA